MFATAFLSGRTLSTCAHILLPLLCSLETPVIGLLQLQGVGKSWLLWNEVIKILYLVGSTQGQRLAPSEVPYNK